MAASSSVRPSFIRRKQVEARTGLARSTIYDRMQAGTFPKPIALGSPRIVAWLESEIDAWVDRQIALSRQADSKETAQ